MGEPEGAEGSDGRHNKDMVRVCQLSSGIDSLAETLDGHTVSGREAGSAGQAFDAAQEKSDDAFDSRSDALVSSDCEKLKLSHEGGPKRNMEMAVSLSQGLRSLASTLSASIDSFLLIFKH